MNICQYIESAQPGDLTIISVSFNSANFLALNNRLTEHLNPGRRFHWIVVENSPPTAGDRAIQAEDPRFYVITGVPVSPPELSNFGYGSMAHAKALNIAISYVKTDCYVLLDPDCYMVKLDWVGFLRKKLTVDGCGFYGTPYHPERLSNFNPFGQTYMYFPAAVCMAVNKKLLEDGHLFYMDYSPQVDGEFYLISYQQMIHSLGWEPGLPIKRRFKNLVRAVRRHGLAVLTHKCRLSPKYYRFDKRKDIGFRIHRHYKSRVKVETTSVRYTRSLPAGFAIWKWLVPQWFTGYPKNPAHWTSERMEYIPGHLEGQGRWEQFFTNGEAFAFHIGKVTYCGDSSDEEIARQIVSNIIVSTDSSSI